MRLSPKFLAASVLAALATAGHVARNLTFTMRRPHRGTPDVSPEGGAWRLANGGGYTIRYSRRHGRKLKPNAAQRRRMPVVHR